MTIEFLDEEIHLETQIASFLVDRQAQQLTLNTIEYYRKMLYLFNRFCQSQRVQHLTEIKTNTIREYLLLLQTKGHNPGGIHACYRAVRVFLRWWEVEYEPSSWKNPVSKVKAPRLEKKILEPANAEIVSKLMGASPTGYLGARDKAAILFLCDTGCRASELTGLDISDYDASCGSVVIHNGKGGKGRTVFVGRKTRRC